MNSTHPSPTASFGFALPLAVLGLTLYNALPSLAEAWAHDIYSRGALPAFVIWLAAPVGLFFQRRPFSKPCMVWLAISVALGVAGSLSDLRVLHHLALATAIPGVFGLRVSGLVLVAAAPTWLPASGWLFLSHWKAGGLIGWERPVCSAILAVLLLAISRSSCPQPQIQPHQP